MTDDSILVWLLIISLTFGCLLVISSSATLGRKLSDIEYQQEAGLNGRLRIQAWINVRTHANRVFLGMTFIVITMLLLADAPVWLRTWVNRLLFVGLLGSYTVASVLDWFDERRQMVLLTRESEELRKIEAEHISQSMMLKHADLLAERENYKNMAAEAIANLEKAAAKARLELGLAPVAPLAPVLPEHNSPVSPEQRETAELATLRGRLVAANLELEPFVKSQDPLGKSLQDMASAADETLIAAERTVIAAESAVDEINVERRKEEEK